MARRFVPVVSAVGKRQNVVAATNLGELTLDLDRAFAVSTLTTRARGVVGDLTSARLDLLPRAVGQRRASPPRTNTVDERASLIEAHLLRERSGRSSWLAWPNNRREDVAQSCSSAATSRRRGPRQAAVGPGVGALRRSDRD